MSLTSIGYITASV